MLHILTTIAVATAWGSMLFFAIAIAPSIFRFLPPEVAGQFIRQLFPVYYLVLLIISAAATALLAVQWQQLWLIVAMALVTLGFALARQWLMPRINRLRDRAKENDDRAQTQFERLHRVSVLLNAGQLLVVLVVLITLLG